MMGSIVTKWLVLFALIACLNVLSLTLLASLGALVVRLNLKKQY